MRLWRFLGVLSIRVVDCVDNGARCSAPVSEECRWEGRIKNPCRSGCRNKSMDLRQCHRTGETKRRSGFDDRARQRPKQSRPTSTGRGSRWQRRQDAEAAGFGGQDDATDSGQARALCGQGRLRSTRIGKHFDTRRAPSGEPARREPKPTATASPLPLSIASTGSLPA